MKVEADSRRTLHMDALRREMMARRSATRAQLARATGLSAMTIGTLLAQMQARGEVRQDETVASAGGRPSTLAVYNADYAHFAVISVVQQEGKNAFTLCVYNLFGEWLRHETMLLDEVEEDSFDAFLASSMEMGYRLRLVVFVLPGEAEGDDIFICDIRAPKGGTFLPRIREKFGVQTLFENDVNAAVYGYASSNEEGELHAGVYFPRRFGPGAGLVMDGEILRGHHHFAGEIGAIHGDGFWEGLDYGDMQQTAEAIAQLMVIYACVTAPSGMVLYGDFITRELLEEICRRMNARLGGRFTLNLTAKGDMAADMQRGAVRLAIRSMLELLS